MRSCRRGACRASQAVLAGANSFARGLAAGSKPFAGDVRWARLSGHHQRRGNATSASPNSHRSLVIYAVFERFTETSIKAVMLSQQEAKLFYSPSVRLHANCKIVPRVLGCPPDLASVQMARHFRQAPLSGLIVLLRSHGFREQMQRLASRLVPDH